MTLSWRTPAPFLAAVCSLGLLLALAACKDSSSSDVVPEEEEEAPPASITRVYNGTASVGDMLTISVDAVARVITYENLTAGHSGTASYVIDSDGSWTINDAANGHLLKGYEIPNFALVMQVANAGPNADQVAVVTAVESQSITTADLVGSGLYNYMQFRTNSGGMELGWLDGEDDGDMNSQYYWPYGAVQAATAAYSATDAMPASAFVPGPGNRYLIADVDPSEPPAYIFRTAGGLLAVDTANGSLVCMRQSSTTAFVDASAGTYRAFTYHKEDATMTGTPAVESGTASLSSNRVVFSRSTDPAHPERGHIRVYDEDDTTIVVDTDLTDLTDGGYIAADKLLDPCPGLFTFTETVGTRTTQVFVTFLDDAALIAAFTLDSSAPSGQYSYFYGSALRVVAGGG